MTTKPERKFKNLSLSVEAVEMLKRLSAKYGTTDSGYIERRIRDDAKAEGIDLKDLEKKQ